ncbi:unnamed protein product [Gordionus sp. m RMFG-2023]
MILTPNQSVTEPQVSGIQPNDQLSVIMAAITALTIQMNGIAPPAPAHSESRGFRPGQSVSIMGPGRQTSQQISETDSEDSVLNDRISTGSTPQARFQLATPKPPLATVDKN